MTASLRNYQGESDYWRIRAFLRQVFELNGRRDRSWNVVRWDYWRWHGNENIEHFRLEDVIWLWEADSEIVGVLNPEGHGEAFLQVHPTRGTPELVEAMVAQAEAGLTAIGPEGGRRLCVWAGAYDRARQALLARRGYGKGEWPEYQRRRSLEGTIEPVTVAAGYCVRALGDAEDLPKRSWVSWRAFHPDEQDEKYEGWTWYPNVQRAPLYRRDLDLVAVAENGEHAAFCTVWFDDVTRTAVFEPVGTAPEHQRRGLGRAVMTEGLRRAQRLGATQAMVASYGAAAHALYEAMGFTTFELFERWRRTW
jgi:predicted N-acetyltransferase YhbS